MASAGIAQSQSCDVVGEHCIGLPAAQKLDGRVSGNGPIACLEPNPNPASRKVRYDYYISYYGSPSTYYCTVRFTCPEVQGMSQTVYNKFCP